MGCEQIAMKLSVLLATICACEVIFWTQASASEGADQAQIMDHLSNTKEIHLTDLCSKAPADALPAACSELEQADPPRSRVDAQQSKPVNPVKTLHRSTEGRPDRSSQKDLLLDGESDQTAPRPKSESQSEQNTLLGDAPSLVSLLAMMLACCGCVLRCLMNHDWKEAMALSSRALSRAAGCCSRATVCDSLSLAPETGADGIQYPRPIQTAN